MGRKTKPGPKELKNLKPIKPGEVRNPQGINRKLPISERHAHRAEELLSATPVGEKLRVKMELPADATWADAWVLRSAVDAARGNLAALAEITDRVEGCAPRRLELSTPGNKLLRIKVVYDRVTQRPTTEDD